MRTGGLLKAASNRRNNRDGVAILDRSVKALEVTHVVVGDENVHELVQFARAIKQTLAKAVVSGVERLQNLTQGARRNLNGGCSAGDGTHGGGDSYGNGHEQNPTE